MTEGERLIEKGRQEGLQNGRREGHQEARREMARKLLLDGMPPDKVAEVVELPPEEVQRLTH